jgi:hypothetical protein
MGLDQYAYAAAKAGQRDEFYEDDNYDKEDTDPTKMSKPREIAYWRNNPNLQGWMSNLHEERYPEATLEYGFNGVELELTWADIERLEQGLDWEQCLSCPPLEALMTEPELSFSHAWGASLMGWKV